MIIGAESTSECLWKLHMHLQLTGLCNDLQVLSAQGLSFHLPLCAGAGSV